MPYLQTLASRNAHHHKVMRHKPCLIPAKFRDPSGHSELCFKSVLPGARASRTPGCGVMQQKWGWLKDLSAADAAYLQSMPFSLSIPSHGSIVTHAGMVPGVPLEQQRLFDLIEVWDKTLSAQNPRGLNPSRTEPL